MRIWFLLILVALAVLLVAVIVGAIIWAVAATRKRRAERGDELTALGFEPVASPPPALRDALASLQAHAEGPPPTIGNLHRRSTPAGELYLLDTQGGDAGHIWLGAGTLAALISDLGAPSLVLLPGAPQPSGGLAQAALQRALDLIGGISGLVRIAYPDDVEFSERFVALGDDEDAVRAFLTDARRTALLELPPAVVFTTKGDLIALSPYPPNTAQAGRPTRALISAAELLLTHLSTPPAPDLWGLENPDASSG